MGQHMSLPSDGVNAPSPLTSVGGQGEGGSSSMEPNTAAILRTRRSQFGPSSSATLTTSSSHSSNGSYSSTTSSSLSGRGLNSSESKEGDKSGSATPGEWSSTSSSTPASKGLGGKPENDFSKISIRAAIDTFIENCLSQFNETSPVTQDGESGDSSNKESAENSRPGSQSGVQQQQQQNESKSEKSSGKPDVNDAKLSKSESERSQVVDDNSSVPSSNRKRSQSKDDEEGNLVIVEESSPPSGHSHEDNKDDLTNKTLDKSSEPTTKRADSTDSKTTEGEKSNTSSSGEHSEKVLRKEDSDLSQQSAKEGQGQSSDDKSDKSSVPNKKSLSSDQDGKSKTSPKDNKSPSFSPAAAPSSGSAPGYVSRPVSLQTLIEHVLDVSMSSDSPPSQGSKDDDGTGMMSVLSKRRTEEPKRSSPQTPSSKSEKSASDSEPAKKPETMCLKDHIDKVLIKNFLSYEKEEQSMNGGISSNKPGESSMSFRSHTEPVHSRRNNVQRKVGPDGTISVQDIVDRVIRDSEGDSRRVAPHGTEPSSQSSGNSSVTSVLSTSSSSSTSVSMAGSRSGHEMSGRANALIESQRNTVHKEHQSSTMGRKRGRPRLGSPINSSGNWAMDAAKDYKNKGGSRHPPLGPPHHLDHRDYRGGQLSPGSAGSNPVSHPSDASGIHRALLSQGPPPLDYTPHGSIQHGLSEQALLAAAAAGHGGPQGYHHPHPALRLPHPATSSPSGKVPTSSPSTSQYYSHMAASQYRGRLPAQHIPGLRPPLQQPQQHHPHHHHQQQQQQHSSSKPPPPLILAVQVNDNSPAAPGGRMVPVSHIPTKSCSCNSCISHFAKEKSPSSHLRQQQPPPHLPPSHPHPSHLHPHGLGPGSQPHPASSTPSSYPSKHEDDRDIVHRHPHLQPGPNGQSLHLYPGTSSQQPVSRRGSSGDISKDYPYPHHPHPGGDRESLRPVVAVSGQGLPPQAVMPSYVVGQRQRHEPSPSYPAHRDAPPHTRSSPAGRRYSDSKPHPPPHHSTSPGNRSDYGHRPHYPAEPYKPEVPKTEDRLRYERDPGPYHPTIQRQVEPPRSVPASYPPSESSAAADQPLDLSVKPSPAHKKDTRPREIEPSRQEMPIYGGKAYSRPEEDRSRDRSPLESRGSYPGHERRDPPHSATSGEEPQHHHLYHLLKMEDTMGRFLPQQAHDPARQHISREGLNPYHPHAPPPQPSPHHPGPHPPAHHAHPHSAPPPRQSSPSQAPPPSHSSVTSHRLSPSVQYRSETRTANYPPLSGAPPTHPSPHNSYDPVQSQRNRLSPNVYAHPSNPSSAPPSSHILPQPSPHHQQQQQPPPPPPQQPPIVDRPSPHTAAGPPQGRPPSGGHVTPQYRSTVPSPSNHTPYDNRTHFSSTTTIQRGSPNVSRPEVVTSPHHTAHPQPISSPYIPPRSGETPTHQRPGSRDAGIPGSLPARTSSPDDQERLGISKHEPIQNIIGSHPPSDILYLICRLCRQTYGSPYGFRKHFRNQHGFEPKAEHTIVQTISATKTAMAHSGPFDQMDGKLVMAGSQKDEKFLPMDIPKSSPTEETKALIVSTDNDKSDLKGDRASENKFLKCLECGQTFQLNDFGSYKRHCRQHSAQRSSGPFACHECQKSFAEPAHLQEHLDTHSTFTPSVCGICRTFFSSPSYLAEHLQAAHSHVYSPSNKTGGSTDCKPVFGERGVEDTFKSERTKTEPLDSPGDIKPQIDDKRSSPSQGSSISALSPSNKVTTSSTTPTTTSNTFSSLPPTKRHRFATADSQLLTVHTPKGLEIQKRPADAVVTTASPDSSYDDAKFNLDSESGPSSTAKQATGKDAYNVSSGDQEKNKKGQNSEPSQHRSDSGSTHELSKPDWDRGQKRALSHDDTDSVSSERCPSVESNSLSVGGSHTSSPSIEDSEKQYKHKKYSLYRKRLSSTDVAGSEPDRKTPKLVSSSPTCQTPPSSSSGATAGSKTEQTVSSSGANSTDVKDCESTLKSVTCESSGNSTVTDKSSGKSEKDAGNKDNKRSGSSEENKPSKDEDQGSNDSGKKFNWERLTRSQTSKGAQPTS